MTLDVRDRGLETVIFHSVELLGILDLRLIEYYKVKHGILQQNLSKYYRFEPADTLCEHFNKFINTLKQERNDESKVECPQLDPSDERKYLSDTEILEKYVDLDISCLTDTENKQVMYMLYKYK